MKNFFLFVCITCLLGACSSNNTKSEGNLQKLVEDAEAALYGDANKVEFNKEKATAVVDAYEQFTTAFPKHANTPGYLFKAAEIYRSLRNFNKAIAAYQTIHKEHTDYEKAPHSLFLLGFSYENDLKQIDKAKEVYQQFLAKYPKHELADDVEFSLSNLGKSPEEIIKQFEEQKKQQQEATKGGES